MYARHKHKTRGHIVMYRAMTETKASEYRSLSRAQNYWVHDTWNGVNYDANRERAYVQGEQTQFLMTYLKRFHMTFYTDSSLAEVRFIKTAGGAPDQLPRREFAPITAGGAGLNVNSVPGLLFLALQDSTYIYVYGWNNIVPLQSNQQLIELNKGDLLMLRGDCIYAMAGGEASNMAIQAYIDTPLFARPEYQVPEIMTIEDDTRDADDVFCFAWNCPFISGTKQSLYKHLNYYHQFYFNQPRATMP